MTRQKSPFAGWQGKRPSGNGVRRSNLPLVALFLAITALMLALTTPAFAQGPRTEVDEPTDDQQDIGSNPLFPLRMATPGGDSAGSTLQPRTDHASQASEDLAPQVTNVALVSRPAVGDTYGVNEMIKVGLTFDTEVEVQGKVYLGMFIGSRWYTTKFLGGSGTDCLIFGRQVQWDDADEDGVTVPGGYVDDDGIYHGFHGRGSIVDAVTGVKTNGLFDRVGSAEDHKVDWKHSVKITDVSIISKPNEGDTYQAGESLEIQLTYEEDMVVEGEVGVSIYVGDLEGSWRGARYDHGAGADKLVFSYTVKRTDVDESGFTVSAGGRNSGYFGSGFIRSQATGLYSSFGYRALHDQSEHKVLGSDDLVSPTVSSLAVTTTPAARDYVTGEEIRVDVVFDEDVTVAGSATLELDFDGVAKVATLEQTAQARSEDGNHASGTNTLTFVYEVAEGDHDPDGFAIGQNKLSLSDGTIEDAAGNDAILDHDAVAAVAVQCVDARNHPPTFNEGDSAARTLDESPSAGALVGDPVVATDLEGQELTYSLNGEDASTFAIDSASGQLRTTRHLSFEYRNTYSVRLTANDGESDAHLDLTIHVTDIDEPGRVNVWRPTPLCTPVLHALLSDPDGRKTDLTWLWEISDDGEDNWSTIGEIESYESSYSPLAADANKFLRITVTYADKFGSGKSVQRIESIGPVVPLQEGCLADASATVIR